MHRTTRAVRLTEAGTSYLADCKRILAEIDTAEALATRAHHALTGQLSITAPLMFGRLHVAPLLRPFLKRHAALSSGDPHRASARFQFARDPRGECASRVVRFAGVLASSRYAEAPHELRAHELIALSGQAEPQAWSFAIDGQLETLSPHARLIVNNADIAIVAARAGLGFSRLLSYQIADEVVHKQLRIVLSDYEPAAVPVYVVHAEGRSATARVRAFVDFAVERLRASLP